MTTTTTKTAAVAVAAGLALGAGLLGGCAGQNRRPQDVSGRYIVAICDADMAATAFGTGDLGSPSASGARDTLTVVKLPLREPQSEYAQIEVSNSALGPPAMVSVTPDGKLAFVVESHKPAGDARTLEELVPGDTLAVIDLSTPLAPKVLGTVNVGERPTAVSVHPKERIVAVINGSARQQLVMQEFDARGNPVGDALAWPLFGLDDDAARATCVAWRPQGDGLAITLPERDEVIFYKFERDSDGAATVLEWGRAVGVGKYPYSGAFTPDGKFFITTDLHWGTDVEGFLVGAPAGQLSVIRVDDGGAHRVVSTAGVGVSPEGLAISNDGRLVATSNLLTTFLPESDPRATRQGSISLLSLSPGTGELTLIDEYPIAAMPAGLSFDARDRFLAVTQFHSFDPQATTGELSFWRVDRKGGRPSLEQMDFFVGLGQGPHGVLIVR